MLGLAAVAVMLLLLREAGLYLARKPASGLLGVCNRESKDDDDEFSVVLMLLLSLPAPPEVWPTVLLLSSILLAGDADFKLRWGGNCIRFRICRRLHRFQAGSCKLQAAVLLSLSLLIDVAL